MRKVWAGLALVCWGLVGCTPKTVISQTYDFDQMRRIGIMAFDNQQQGLQGVENLFAKYLIQRGFTVIERAQLESILAEHHIAVSGYLSPQTTREIGRILGVDVLLVGEVSDYIPARTELALTASRRTEARPVYRQEVMRRPDGTYAGYLKKVGTRVSQSADVLPTEYTISGRVGLIAKLVDVETAEIVWIGSADAASSSALETSDHIAKQLVKSFEKELAKRQRSK